MKKMDINRVSDEEVQGLFEESFKDQVGSYNNIEEFEAKCQREVGGTSIKVEVTIQGLAGSPNAEDWKKGKVKKANVVCISREDKGSLTFNLIPKDVVYLNSTEYIVVYKSV